MSVQIDSVDVEVEEPRRTEAAPRAAEERPPDERKLLECIAHEQWRQLRLTAD